MSGVAPSESGLARDREHVVHDGRRARTRGAGQHRDGADGSASGAGEATLDALNGGYHAAFLVGGLFVVVLSAVLAALLLRSRPAEHGAGEMGRSRARRRV